MCRGLQSNGLEINKSAGKKEKTNGKIGKILEQSLVFVYHNNLLQ